METVDNIAVSGSGATLAQAREASGLSVAEVAKRLRLSISQIEALEADAYDKLPGPTFARGFIRNYARLLQIDSTPLLMSSTTTYRSFPEKGSPTAMRSIPFPSKKDKAWRGYAFAGVLIGLIIPFVVFEAKQQTITVSKIKETVPKAESQHPVISDPIPPLVAADGVTETNATSPLNKKSIRLVFSQESWTEVKDTYGNIIFSQLSPAGSEQTVEGEPPFSLVVGNASGVKIAYNEQPIDLTPYTKAEIARLTLQ